MSQRAKLVLLMWLVVTWVFAIAAVAAAL